MTVALPIAWAWTPALAAAGGVLAAAPIIIHLLNRRRFRILDWAAMRFLLESRRKNRRRLRIEELLLLALRVLLCLLLGLALANIRGGSILGGPGAPVAHVFILDDSLSMGQQAGPETLFRRAAAHVADLVGSLPGTDKVAFISATQPENQEPFGRLMFAQDLQGRNGDPAPGGEAKRRSVPALAALKPNDLRARFPEALAAAEKVLAGEKDLTRRLYVVSDFRQGEFADRAGVETLRKAFARLAALPAEIVLMDYGAPAPSNLTVEKVELLDKAVVANLKARFQARIRNYGTQPVEGAAMTIQVGPVALPTVPLEPVGPGETIGKTFSYTFTEAGSAAVSVSVTPDMLPADNTASLAVNVREAIKVLAVDGSPDAANPSAGAAFCLSRAIDPRANGEFGQRCEVVPVQNLPEVNFEDYDAVILANVGEFPAGRDEGGKVIYPQLDALDRYVRAGGGLALFVGDRVNLDFYNGPFFAEGSGLSPLRLSAPVPATIDPNRFVRFRPDSIAAEPMLRVFTGRSQQFTRLVRFYVTMPAIEAAPTAPARDAGPVQVLARFDDRESFPAVVRRTLGRGTVLMWYSSADVRWTDWPKDLTFLPVINDMVAGLARGDGAAYHAPVGQAIHYPLPPALVDSTGVTLTTPAYPDEDVAAMQVRVEGKRKVIEYAAPRWAGVYELKFALPDKSERRILFSRHSDPAESDLAKADKAEIERAVGQDHVYQGGLATAAAAVGRSSSDKAYWWILLALVLGGLGVEIVLAQRFGHYAPVAAGSQRR